MTTGILTGLASSLADDLAASHRDVSHEGIETEVNRALDDLRGSVSFEALPEMAARLASYRLSRTPGDATLWYDLGASCVRRRKARS